MDTESSLISRMKDTEVPTPKRQVKSGLYSEGGWTLNGQSIIVTFFFVPILGHLATLIAVPKIRWHTLPTMALYVIMIFIVVFKPRTVYFRGLYVIMMVLGYIMIIGCLIAIGLCALTSDQLLAKMVKTITGLKFDEDDLVYVEGNQKFPLLPLFRLLSITLAAFTITRTYVVMAAFKAVRRETRHP